MDLLERQRTIDTQDTVAKTSLFTEYPRASNVYGTPLLTTLYYCSMYHWNTAAQLNSPPTFRHAYKLSDRQYLWAVVRGRARVRHYYLPDQLSSLLQAKVRFL